MKFREYIDIMLSEAEELIPVNTQFKDETSSSETIDDVGETGAEVVSSEEVPSDAVDIDKESSETKWEIKGASNIDDAWKEYNKRYIPKLLSDTARVSGIGKGKFYTLGITSKKAGKLGNAETHETEDGPKLSREKQKKAKSEAFLLVSQCRVKEIGIVEGFYKKYVLGVRIQLTGDAIKKRIGEWLEKCVSKIEPGTKKFKHIKTDTNEYSSALGPNEYAVPIHWIPRLREAIEQANVGSDDSKTIISKQHRTAEKEKQAALEAGEKYTSSEKTNIHPELGRKHETSLKEVGRRTIKLPSLGKKN